MRVLRSRITRMEKLELRQLLAATPADIAAALDLAGVTPSYSGNPVQVASRVNINKGGLLGFPTGPDSDYLVLSTGVADQLQSENSGGSQGTDLGDDGVDGDSATITFSVPVPASSRPQKFKFDFMFLSEEYPEFVDSSFNDIFSAKANSVEMAIDQGGNPISINSVLFTGDLATGTFFDGRTLALGATYNVLPGDTSIDVVFNIADVGDGRYDSAVLLDNVRFEQQQLVYLNFEGQNVGAHLRYGSNLTLPAFQVSDIGEGVRPRNEVIDSIVNQVKKAYENYDIDFTTTKPAEGEYTTVVIGGSNTTQVSLPAGLTNAIDNIKVGTTPTIAQVYNVLYGEPGTLLGLSVLPVDIGNRNKSDLAIVLSGDHNFNVDPLLNIGELTATIAHELGHNLGLRHVQDVSTPELMRPKGPYGLSSTFNNEAIDLQRGGWPDGATNQNSDAYLRSILGAKGGGSSITPSANFKSFKRTFVVGGKKPIFNVDVGISSSGSEGSTEGGEAGQVVTHFDLILPGQTITLPTALPGDSFFLFGASKEGGPIDVISGKAAGGELTSEKHFIPLFDDEGNPIESFPLSTGEFGNLKSFGTLSLEPTNFADTTVLPDNRATFTDADGDRYTVRLTGPGTVAVILDTTNTQGGNFIDQIVLQDTDETKSRLSISVSKRRGGEGLVKVGRISGGGVSRITAGKADLVGAGINLNGHAGRITLHDVLNGADISTLASADPESKTRLTLRNVADNSAFTIGTPISRFTAKLVGDTSLTAVSIDRLTVTGDCSMDLVSGALGTATVGKLLNARWNLSGDVSSITMKQMIDSSIYGAVDSAVTGLPTAFNGQLTIKKVTISGIRSDPVGFSNSFIAAPNLGTISIRKAITANAAQPFGLAANTLKSITIRNASQTILRWNDRQDPSLLAPQEDLVVNLI